MSRKELKAPDAFQKAGRSVREWLQERQAPLVIGAALILVVGGIVALSSHLSKRKEVKADKTLGSALKAAGQPELDEDEPPEKPPPTLDSRAKDERLIKELTAARSKYPRTQAALTAQLPIAGAELRTGQYDLALAHFEEYLRESPPTEVLRAQALEGEGYAYEAKGQLDLALAAFERMGKESKDGFLTGMGDYHKARILILQNKKTEAAAVLSELKASHPGTAAARQAAERLTRLVAEGVVVPPPKGQADGGQSG